MTLQSRLLALLPRNLGLSTTYSLTKVCLECNTCSHNENVEKFSHRIEALPEKFPSFEFGLKASLDEHEFCDKVRIKEHSPPELCFHMNINVPKS